MEDQGLQRTPLGSGQQPCMAYSVAVFEQFQVFGPDPLNVHLNEVIIGLTSKISQLRLMQFSTVGMFDGTFEGYSRL